MTGHTRAHKSAEQQTGLDIEKVETAARMDFWLDSGLASVYQMVFAEAPYFEKFTKQEVRETFHDFIASGGCVLIASEDGYPAAFVASVPLKTKFNLAAEACAGLDPEKTAYFAEDGVDPGYRRQGLSGQMKKLLIEQNKLNGMTHVLLRTSQNSYRQISAVNKEGGAVIPGVFDDVESTRLDGKTSIDRRGFYLFDLLKRKRKPDVIDDVTIRRIDGKDVAYLLNLEESRREKMAHRIMETYPGISRVAFEEEKPVKRGFFTRLRAAFGGSAKRKKPATVFRGRLYLAHR